MDSEDGPNNSLKNYLDALPSQAVLPMPNPNYDEDDEDDEEIHIGIRGFEDSDSSEEDDDNRLSLWPRHHNDPQPSPHALDEMGVFCREWGRPTTVMRQGSKRALWTAPLIPQSLFGFSPDEVIANLGPDPTTSIEIIQTSDLDQGTPVTNSSEINSPELNKTSIDDLGPDTVLLVESPSETLVESPSEGSPHRVIPQASPISDLPTSESFTPRSALTEDLSPQTLLVHTEHEPPRSESPKLNQALRLVKTGSTGQQIINTEDSTNSGHGGRSTISSETTKNYIISDIRGVPGSGTQHRYSCPAEWCSLSFTRENDAVRHFRNAAIHRKIGDPDNSTRCRKCGEELSRLDARKRHERKNACGKRRLVRRSHESRSHPA